MLYIGGFTGTKKPQDHSWYFKIKSALSAHPEAQTQDDGTLTLSDPQTKDPDRAEQKDRAQSAQHPAPSWLFTPPPGEPAPPKPFIPSQQDRDEEETYKPSATITRNYDPFLRGNITHKLLEILPDLPDNNRHNAAKEFLSHFGHELPESVRADILNETIAILSHPDFKPLFTPEAKAEISITGMLAGGRILNGQIDRLLVAETNIYIIDYKTGRAPPASAKDIPPAYKRQLAAYAAILQEIYPNRAVHTALLWTDGPILMPVPIDENEFKLH
jgi:ATP-dependent helicase/nuclease subunit A